MKVCKFGGTSVSSVDSIKRVAEIINSDSDRRYIIVSAPGKRWAGDDKITDMLYALADADGEEFNEVFKKLRDRFSSLVQDLCLHLDVGREFDDLAGKIREGVSKDFVASRGEYLSAKMIAELLGARFVDAKDLVKFEGIALDFDGTIANIKRSLGGERAVIPGFYGSREDGEIKTFSRGGSDITGALVACAVNADMYENWTDVDGVYSADPRKDAGARLIERMTYKEMYDLARQGANVLHEDAVYPAERAHVPINIKNTFNPSAHGTIIE